ncbi:Hint domain-containing protein [Paracoccus litorisediminis]|uniref:Hint domain-containing protein n=1 Tax=Paracoccus litorisediminis TaxID=2006130 RepID=UPI00372E2DF2
MATFTISIASFATGQVTGNPGSEGIQVSELPLVDFVNSLPDPADSSAAVIYLTVDDSYIQTGDLDGDGVDEQYIVNGTPISSFQIDADGDGTPDYDIRGQNPNDNQLQVGNQEGDNIARFNGNATIYETGTDTVAGTLPSGNLYISNDGPFPAPGEVKPVVNDGSGTFTVDDFPVCYLRGTRIMTVNGEVEIENLKAGDLVVCRFGGVRQIKWIGLQTFSGLQHSSNRAIRFAPGSISENVPREPLFVSAGHSMLIGETLVLADDLVNGITITREKHRTTWEYLQLDLGVHDLVLAEGTWSETFADCGNFRDRFDNVQDYRALFPDEVAPTVPVLCAPRPTAGADYLDALEQTARIALGVREGSPSGRLEGTIEGLAAPSHVTGWAMDAAHPGQPLALDLVLDGEVIGTTIACVPRRGKGRKGHMGFVFSGYAALSMEELQRVVVRRAADGQIIAPVLCANPGPMHGHVDRIDANGRIDGWARDKVHPNHPVLLEVLLGAEVLGTALACHHRSDLAKVEFGNVAFTFQADRALSIDEMELVQVRRVGDAAILRRSDSTRLISAQTGATKAA